MLKHDWSPQQEAIFRWFAQPQEAARNLVVRARAGCAKTTSIIEGINRAPEREILLAAFNKRIATELKDKIATDHAEAKTLHGLGYSYILRQWSGLRIDNTRGARLARQVMGDQSPDEMVKLVAKLATLGKEMRPFASAPEQLSEIAAQFECAPDEEWEEDGWTVTKIARYALSAMTAAQNRDGTIEFSDMLYLPLAMKWARGRYDLVVVDEAQDQSPAQILLAQRACRKGGRIVVVGDERQAIYGWRGADTGVIDRLKAELGATELGLTVTYRCPKAVVALAAKLVPDFTAAETAPAGAVRALGLAKLPEAVAPGDFVLSRKNANLMKVCLSILRTGKKARIEGRDVGKGLIALVRKMKPKSIPHFFERLAAWEERGLKRADAMNSKAGEGAAELIRDQAETLRALAEGLSGPQELIARIEALFDDAGERGDFSTVVCSSIHRAKGLERERVFVLMDTLYPKRKPRCPHCRMVIWDNECRECGRPAPHDAAREQEEQNLHYVAITRAKSELVLVSGE